MTLHLWRIAKSTELEECFAKARELRMIDDENERFMREMLSLNEAIEAGAPEDSITEEMVKELQACVLRLNSADPA